MRQLRRGYGRCNFQERQQVGFDRLGLSCGMACGKLVPGRPWARTHCSAPFEDPGGSLPGEIPCILYIYAYIRHLCCEPSSAAPPTFMPLPSRNTSAGRPVVLDTALLPCSFLPAKETRSGCVVGDVSGSEKPIRKILSHALSSGSSFLTTRDILTKRGTTTSASRKTTAAPCGQRNRPSVHDPKIPGASFMSDGHRPSDQR